MSIIRHRQRAITSASPVPGQGRWINPNKADRFAQLTALAQSIKDNAGVPAGITPGVDSGVTPGSVAPSQNPGSAILINSLGIDDTTPNSALFWSDFGNGGSGSIGTGAFDDPVVIKDISQNSLANGFQWDDPTATYYIRLENCQLSDTAGVTYDKGTLLLVNTATTLTMSQCTQFKNGGSGISLHKVEAGDLDCIACLYSGVVSGGLLQKNGAGTITYTDCQVDDSASDYSVGTPLFWNQATGGLIKFTRVTYALNPGVTLTGEPTIFTFDLDCSLEINQSLFNSKANSDIDRGMLHLLGTSAPSLAMVPLQLQKTFTNCSVFGGSGAIIKSDTPASEAISNLTMTHCDVYQNTVGIRALTFGPSSPADSPAEADIPKNIKILACKLEKTNDGTVLNGNPGNELLELFGSRDCEIGFCYVVGCPEDALEYWRPRTNNSIHDCVGGAVRNQLCDYFYGATPVLDSSGSNCTRIFGTCKSDALSAFNIDGLTWSDILVALDASIPGDPNTAPIAEVGLFSNVVNFPTNIRGAGLVTQDSEAPAGVAYADQSTGTAVNVNNAVQSPAIVPT